MKFYLIQFGIHNMVGERNPPFSFKIVSSINTGLKLLRDDGFVESDDEPTLHKEDRVWTREAYGTSYWASFYKHDVNGNVSALTVDDQRSFP
jgi:hypothetical protein